MSPKAKGGLKPHGRKMEKAKTMLGVSQNKNLAQKPKSRNNEAEKNDNKKREGAHGATSEWQYYICAYVTPMMSLFLMK